MVSRRSLISLIGQAGFIRAQQTNWRVVHRAEEPILLRDLAVSDEGMVVAAGVVEAGESRPRALISLDGVSWKTASLPDVPESVCCLEAGILWMAGARGLWKSPDRGASWKLARQTPHLKRVLFTGKRGFAAGAEKTVLRTEDGGETWTPLAAAAEPPTAASFTTYTWIDFPVPQVGIIAGTSRPPRQGITGPLPAWRDPRANLRRREWPAASITLETRDGGRSWKHSVTSLFGSLTRVRYTRDGRGLALVEFHDAFEWPSEVFSIDLHSGKSGRVFREKDRAITDLLAFRGGPYLLAAIEPPPDPEHSTLGPLHVLASDDLVHWSEQTLSEEILAGRAWLAGRFLDAAWLATDTGVILRCTI